MHSYRMVEDHIGSFGVLAEVLSRRSTDVLLETFAMHRNASFAISKRAQWDPTMGWFHFNVHGNGASGQLTLEFSCPTYW